MSITHPELSRRYTLAGAALLALVALAALLLARGSSRAEAGQFLNFPGPDSGYVEVPHAPALNPTAAITVEAWVNLRSYAPSGAAPFCPTILGKNFDQAYWFGICDGRLRLIVRDDITLDGDSVVPLNTWTHVAGTYDGQVMRLYVDAVPDGNKDIGPGLIGVSTDSLRIGNDVAWDASPDGLLDEVRLWSAARNNMQIATTMNTTITTATTDLVAAWNFDGDLTDPIGAHNGTAQGDVGIVASVPTPTPSPTPSPTATPTLEPSPTETPTPTPTDTPSPSPSPSATPSPTPVPKGDVNCSGTVTAVDSLQILRWIAGLPVNLPQGCAPIGS